MKRRRNHVEAEAWIMALLLPAVSVIGGVAGWAVSWLSRMLGAHPH